MIEMKTLMHFLYAFTTLQEKKMFYENDLIH